MNRSSKVSVILAVLAIVVLFAAFFLDQGAGLQLMLLPLVGGIAIGAVMFWQKAPITSEALAATTDARAEIRSDKIMIRGGWGAGVLIVLLLGAVLIDLPVLRWIALPGMIGGLLLGGALVLWRTYRGE